MAAPTDSKADADKKDASKAEASGAPKKGKKMLVIGGVAASVLALAALMAVVTVGKGKQERAPEPELEGPFVAKLSSSEIQVNLAGEGSKRYLVMALNVEFLVYSEHYVTGRLTLPAAGGGGHGEAAPEDPLYTARIKDALLKIAASKTRDEVTNPALADAFMEEIRRAIDPILFPIHVGDAFSVSTPDSLSGLRPGESIFKSTLRGLLHEHVLHFDGPGGKIALDDGDAVAFKSTDRDLALTNKLGEIVYVDAAQAKSNFRGDVSVGRPGRLTQVYRESFLVQ